MENLTPYREIARSNVVLPSPFLPTNPYLRPNAIIRFESDIKTLQIKINLCNFLQIFTSLHKKLTIKSCEWNASLISPHLLQKEGTAKQQNPLTSKISYHLKEILTCCHMIGQNSQFWYQLFFHWLPFSCPSFEWPDLQTHWFRNYKQIIKTKLKFNYCVTMNKRRLIEKETDNNYITKHAFLKEMPLMNNKWCLFTNFNL